MVLKVEHLQAGKMVQDISFELRKGEILGFSGLMGAGRTETARAIFGADKKESGDIYVNGRKVEIHSPPGCGKSRESGIFPRTGSVTAWYWIKQLRRTPPWRLLKNL